MLVFSLLLDFEFLLLNFFNFILVDETQVSRIGCRFYKKKKKNCIFIGITYNFVEIKTK